MVLRSPKGLAQAAVNALTEAESARLSRAHNDANIIALGARLTSEAEAATIVRTFLETQFQGGRHADRVAKIRGLEGD